MDWALPTDEILAVAKTASPEGCAIAPPKAADSGAEHGLASQLRKFAAHLKQAF
jgi:pyridoxine 5'-phosphate synthase PdxJ